MYGKTNFKLLVPIIITLAFLLFSLPTMAEKPLVLLTTEKGEITLQLFPELAPKSVVGFLNLVEDFHYDGLIFHRVIEDFMIQSGGYTFDMTRREPTAPDIVSEASNGLQNKRGTVALARTSDPNSARAQFFINHRNNPSLDPNPKQAGYTVFGEVISGMPVVDEIAKVPTGIFGDYQDVPKEPIRILSAKLLNPIVWEKLRPRKLSFERPIPVARDRLID